MRFSDKFLASLIITLSVVFGIAFYGCYTGAWNEEAIQPFSLASAESKPEFCTDAETRELVRGMMVDGLEVAFKQHVANTFLVWMKDQTAQPERAKNGIERGIKAYVDARKGVAEWSPPPCAG